MISAAVLLAAIDWTKWSAIGTLAAATATVLLALATFWLVLMTKRAVEVTRKGLDDEWGREWARQRPLVYPYTPVEWAQGHQPRKTVLLLKNGGRGPALNVRGAVTATSHDEQYTRAIVAGTIAAGDSLEARIEAPGIDDWSTASGVLSYSDLAGGDYEARFEFELGPGDELSVTIHEATHVTPASRSLEVPGNPPS
jgi:hypothetical protein